MIKKALLISVIAIAIVMVCGCASEWHANEQYVTSKVIDKHIDYGTEGTGDDKHTVSYYVVVTEAGAFEVRRANEWFDTSMNPDILYAKIKPDHTYNFTTYGYRVENWPGQYQYPIIANAIEVNV